MALQNHKRITAILPLVILLLMSCESGGGTLLRFGDKQVEVTAPGMWQQIDGPTMIRAWVDEQVDIREVTFFVDGVQIGTDDERPFELNWAPKPGATGTHTIYVVAKDVNGNQQKAHETIKVLIAEKKPPDVIQPAVTVTWPAAYHRAADQVIIRVEASDDSGAPVVTFLIDGQPVNTVSQPPFRHIWKTKGVVGNHTIAARAVDKAGNFGVSKVIPVTVGSVSTSTPSVWLLAPANTAVVSGKVVLKAMAKDDTGVAKVEFVVDGVSVGAVTQPTGGVYTLPWDSTTVADGARSVVALVTDIDGDTGHAVPVSIRVANLDLVPPSVWILNPAPFQTLCKQHKVILHADDPSTVAKVYYRIDAQSPVVVSEAPLTWTLDTTKLSVGLHYLSVVAIDQAGNHSPMRQVVITVEKTPGC
ncbi:MAG: hypothetical protein KC502_14440 [Myxococcales bacterium]|nr:hypothetical protein [Myxococcales bacterium]